MRSGLRTSAVRVALACLALGLDANLKAQWWVLSPILFCFMDRISRQANIKEASIVGGARGHSWHYLNQTSCAHLNFFFAEPWFSPGRQYNFSIK